ANVTQLFVSALQWTSLTLANQPGSQRAVLDPSMDINRYSRIDFLSRNTWGFDNGTRRRTTHRSHLPSGESLPVNWSCGSVITSGSSPIAELKSGIGLTVFVRTSTLYACHTCFAIPRLFATTSLCIQRNSRFVNQIGDGQPLKVT